MWTEALDTISPEIWSKTIEKTNKEIKKYWDREVAFDREDIIHPIIINLNGSDTDDSSDEELFRPF